MKLDPVHYQALINLNCRPNYTTVQSTEHHRELQELRVAHADTINELEKTRKLLQLQHNINKDYKKEVHVYDVHVY